MGTPKKSPSPIGNAQLVLTCRSLRIGSYKIISESVSFSTAGVRFTAPNIGNNNKKDLSYIMLAITFT